MTPLPCLFIVRVITAGLRKIFKSDSLFYTSGIFCYFLGYFLYSKDINLPFHLDSAITSVAFFVMGGGIRCIYQYINKIHWFVPMVLSFIYVVVCVVVNPHVNIKDNIFPIYHILLCLCAIVPLLYLCAKIENKKWKISNLIKSFGLCSLTLLGLHRSVFYLFTHNPLYGILNTATKGLYSNPWVSGLIMVFFALLSIYYIDILLKQYVPFVVGKASKKAE